MEDVGVPDKTGKVAEIRLQRGWTIRGRVLDEQGRPVRGAEVTAAVETCGIDVITPEARMLSGIEFMRATSDEQGGYEIRHLAGRCYEVRARAEGLLPAAADVGDWGSEGATAENVDFYLREGKSISGVVVDPSGTPVAGACVAAGSSEVESDGNGKFTLQGVAGTRVLVTASRGGEQVSTTLLMPADATTLMLRPLAAIAGQVLASQGTSFRAKVLLVGRHGLQSTQDVAGRTERAFEFSVPPDTYELLVLAPGFAPTRLPEVLKVKAGERRSSIDIQLAAEATIKGKVVLRSTGAPVSGAAVSLKPTANLWSSPATATDPDGAFMRLHGRPRRSVPLRVRRSSASSSKLAFRCLSARLTATATRSLGR